MSTYKVVVFGNNDGKTSMLHRYIRGVFDSRYIATIGADVYPCVFKTNYGDVTINFWDCASIEKFGGLRDGYYIMADAGIIFINSNASKKNQYLRDDFHRVNPGKFILSVQGKADINQASKGAYPVSAKSNTGIKELFIDLLCKLMNKTDVVIQ